VTLGSVPEAVARIDADAVTLAGEPVPLQSSSVAPPSAASGEDVARLLTLRERTRVPPAARHTSPRVRIAAFTHQLCLGGSTDAHRVAR
jgi:hypothetical protein